MEAYSPLYLLIAAFAAGLGLYGIFRGRSEDDSKSFWIGVALPILAWLVTSPGPLFFCALLGGVGIFSDELGVAWLAAGKKAATPAPKSSRRPPPPRRGR